MKHNYQLKTKQSIILITFRQQLLLPQQLLNIDWLAVSEGVGLGALEATGPPTFFSAPTKGKSTSTNSRS